MGRVGAAVKPWWAGIQSVTTACASLVWGCAGADETQLFLPDSTELAVSPPREVDRGVVAERESGADLAANEPEGAPPERGLPPSARPLVSVLADPEVAAGLCRREVIAQTALDSASEAERVERCEGLWAACEAAEPVGAEFSSTAAAVLAVLPSALGDSGCVLPTEGVEACSAQLVGLLASNSALGTCREPQPFVSVSDLLQLPACLLLLPSCPQLVAVLASTS